MLLHKYIFLSQNSCFIMRKLVLTDRLKIVFKHVWMSNAFLICRFKSIILLSVQSTFSASVTERLTAAATGYVADGSKQWRWCWHKPIVVTSKRKLIILLMTAWRKPDVTALNTRIALKTKAIVRQYYSHL